VKDYSACLAYNQSDDTKCITCGFGTVLAGSKCVGAINCGTSATQCPACLSGFTLTNGNCVDKTGNCMSVGPNGVCTTCNNGYSLVGYTCIPDSEIAPYACYIYDNNATCLLCKNGYNIYQDNCLIPSEIQSI
jgi:hypothetical protein